MSPTSRPENGAPTLAKRIADSLARRVVEGAYPVGCRLPTERELAIEFGANRNAVREAIKRLEAMGVLESRRGAGTYVAGVGFQAGVQFMDSLITHEDGTVNLQALREVLEFRVNMARLIVRAAAARRTDEQLEEIRVLSVERRSHRGNPARVEAIMLRLFKAIAEASHNRAYIFLHNTASQAYVRLWSTVDLPRLGADQLDIALDRLIAAIGDRDPVGAELVLARFMERLQLQLFGEVDPVLSSPFSTCAPHQP